MEYSIETRRVLKMLGKVNPLSIQDYIREGGFEGLKKVLRKEPEVFIGEVVNSGLKGRGGAGFPTGLKMKYVRGQGNSHAQKYVVCNADEGEPGTFKDRVIMENIPFQLIEGMLLAGYAIGAVKGFLYIRGEYTLCIENLKKAIAVCRSNGMLGENIFGSNFSFDIELSLGAGSYLCGEELTLIESLEGKRGHPRIKPPFPAEKGLFQQPTLVNNVETLCNLPGIAKHESHWLKQLGTQDSPGTKIFTISGDVNNPGFYELPMGITLKDLVFGLGGGIAGNKKFKAALLGGAAGTFVNESLLETGMSYELLTEKNATLGSGAVIVFDDTKNIKDSLRNILRFFKHESCGKCVPCRTGCAALLDIIDESKVGYTEKLLKEAQYMTRTSLCPLGQSPVLPIKSALYYFPDEFYK